MKNKLMDIFNDIDDQFIEEVNQLREQQPTYFNYRTILGVGITSLLIMITMPHLPKQKIDTPIDVPGISIVDVVQNEPPITIESEIADMIGCIMYKGHIYLQMDPSLYSQVIPEDVIDTYLGEATGSLDEWSSQEEWSNEFASTFSGSVYRMKGYEEDVRICIYSTDSFYIFENYQDSALSTGKSFYEDRYHVVSKTKQIDYLTFNDWNENGPLQHHFISFLDDQFSQFLNVMKIVDASPFIHLTYEEAPAIYEAHQQTHLYLTLEDNTQIEMVFIEGGYVTSPLLYGNFVKIDQELIQWMIDLA